MRTSILETVDLNLGPVAAGVSEQEARALIDAAERQGLLTRRGTGSAVTRAHPLVRDFLEARLSRSEGQRQVQAFHRRVATGAEAVDWQIASHHYHAADSDEDARRVLAESVQAILAQGRYAAALEVAAVLQPAGIGGIPGLVVESKAAQQRGAVFEALALAERARQLDPSSEVALLNIAGARLLAGDVASGLDAARELEQSDDVLFATLGRATVATMSSSVDGSLEGALNEIAELSAALE